ncbi:aromatic amino acid aminotransferase [Grosmannia clavigera kw1407]|uniref:Aromatic amino acid aminotransferase n=1 Tax=Grosmannia clavigera (strain kw1407 / UAMH 11150) TaxID=655863 RepID=F0XLY0_GROCL|nr:aromatic amino acid aminotransferase [Grosmannia clavigera kw1407]EFX01316.1 aromatic amino acid aminotransferase [Grosmannia clavigera kw1407]
MMDQSAASLVSSADSNASVESSRSPMRSSAAALSEKPLPLDLTHLISEATKLRKASRMKQYYKFFQIPGAGNLAGGLPHVSYFPYDTLEAQIAQPDRWLPSPQTAVLSDGTNTDDEDDDAILITGKMAGAKLASSVSSARTAPAASLVSPPNRLAPVHLQIPKTVPPSAPDKKIDLASALQYGGSDGYAPLLSWVRSFVRDHVHPNVPYRGGPEVIMTVGATDGLSKTLELFVNRWNPTHNDVRDRPGLLVEPFIYGNALSQAAAYGLQIVTVEADEGGMLAYGPGGLEDVLSSWDSSRGRRPHMLYNVTLGHNPTGIILSIERRRELYAVCSRFDVVIIEDDPYWHLQYPSAAEAEAVSRNLPRPKPAPLTKPIGPNQRSSGYDFLDSLVPSFLSIDVDGRVIRLDTFSKTVAPGCRVGWITAQPDLIEKFVRITEGTTSQPSGFVQSLLSELVRGPTPAALAAAVAGSSSSSRGVWGTKRSSPSSSGSLGTSNSFAGWQTDGWVRWLEGVRGEYERRMTQMCTILDDNACQLKQGTPVRPSEADWGVITKTKLYSFSWPRAGMFVWVRMHFETHPLWQAARSGSGGDILDGPAMQMALLLLLTSKPHLVIISPGDMFSASDEVHEARGWAYFRLCFAAESDENLVASTHRLVAGIQKFWKIKRVKEIEDLLESSPITAEDAASVTNLGGLAMGC